MRKMNAQLLKAREKVCLPLDNLNTMETAEARVKALHEYVGLFKVGKGSFTRFGPDIVKMVKKHGANVFLDLKYHDIPNTVKDAACAATEMGVNIFNVHAFGGSKMMFAALEGADETAKRLEIAPPKVIAVTVLTSINIDILYGELNVELDMEDQVLHLAQMTADTGLDGIVCSANDLSAITQFLPKDFMYITPGIVHPNKGMVGSDQKRIATPRNAIEDGASILVVGRAITGYETVEEQQNAAHEILVDIAEVL
ncbi:orotidine-5'-phosphate decarboxylase [Candidatus Micrarchaeota archaeon]|nr:orotidine-5'-phosphate decarboxylase [Candidatus Micrarchaeota archaeon]